MQVPDRYWDRFKDADAEAAADDPKKEDVAAHAGGAGDVREHRRERRPGAGDARRAEARRRTRSCVYFSDNGPNGWRWNGGMKGRKGSTDEGGVRSPLLVRWPGHIKPGTNGDADRRRPSTCCRRSPTWPA